MQKENTKSLDREISAENLAKTIWSFLREEIVASSVQENNVVRARFPNGKTLLVSVEEL